MVRFGHRSVFPVSLAGSGTRQWWHDHLTFTLYYRPPTDRAVGSVAYTVCSKSILSGVCFVVGVYRGSRVAQWERAGPITQRSMDRNHPLLAFLQIFALFNVLIFITTTR